MKRIPYRIRFDKKLTEKLKKIGGEIQKTLTKNTDIVIVKKEDEDTSKVNDARKAKIPIETLDNFIKIYELY